MHARNQAVHSNHRDAQDLTGEDGHGGVDRVGDDGNHSVPTTPDPVAGSFMHVQMCVYGLSCCPSGHDIDIDTARSLLYIIIISTKRPMLDCTVRQAGPY